MKVIIFNLSFSFIFLSMSLGQNIDDMNMKVFRPTKKMQNNFNFKFCDDQLYEEIRNCINNINDSINDVFIVQKIKDGIDSYNSIEIPIMYISCHYRRMIPQMIKLLKNKNESDIFGIILPIERAKLGLLCEFCGQNSRRYGIIETKDDINKVAGRANYILKELTGKNFGSVKVFTTDKELYILQKKWIKWIKKRCR